MLFYELNKEQKQIILLSAIGGMLEYYDFAIYSLFAVYFAHQFLPSSDPLLLIIASYSVFLTGYIARPLGGILFSHIGDEIGRKTVLIITMVIMGVASLSIGLLPTYSQIGILAPILLLFFRLIQGLAIGGELPSVIVYVTESMPDKRGFGVGGIYTGTISGLIPGMLINFVIIHYLSIDQINSFGWRIPFILGGLLCFIAYQVRKKLHETKAFQRIKEKDKFPFIELLRHHFKEVVIGAALGSIMAVPLALVSVFMPTYLHKIVGLPMRGISSAILIATIISAVSVYLMGALANKFNLVKLIIGSTILVIIAAIFCYYGIAHSYNLTLSIGIFAIFQGAIITLPPIFMSYLFPAHVRLSGVALSYNIASVIFVGLTPIIVTSIIGKTGWVFVAPVLWLMFVAVISIIAALKAKKYINNNS